MTTTTQFMNGKMTDVPHNLNRVIMLQASDYWEINANVAMLNAETVNINGIFTSRIDNNADPLAGFPQNFKPDDFRNVVPCGGSVSAVNLITDSTKSDWGNISSDTPAMKGDIYYVNLTYILNKNQEINILPVEMKEKDVIFAETKTKKSKRIKA